MRFGTVDGRGVVVRDETFLDLARATDDSLPHDPLALLARWDDVVAAEPTLDWSVARRLAPGSLGAPVPAPRQVFAIALNYRPHAAEAGWDPPGQPLVFTKFPSCVVGPDVDVTLPEGHVDWEIEVVAVVGRGGYRIPREEAWDALAGITVGQDLSERVQQLAGKPPQFSLAKSHPGFGPIGPLVVTPGELPDRDAIGFASFLDDEPLQSGSTADLIFPVDDLVARLSEVCRLLPGDLIFTGTPEGVGNRRTPPRFLQPGETLVSRVDGVGEIVQRFR
ncbi:FAA hydrolase family protein [Nocardioides mangrovicus]|uniref:FAA hydrolase family protein n=1 Tax=Nocardioides mangrovicus TaxID=2478913 RepID=A0A3L8P3L2_9ACTN|nr:fumarylacetoacetate hydrolase family protein [Nocardioides mangrovicus]RLV49980.1 FAA hydrolase family protein [Nocardioides mangrovicus]